MKLISLKELQKRALNLLCEFDKVCRANGIKYSLAYGTLLGAIRHKGFIPWDDDVDVMLPRPEYDKFLTISKQNPKLFSDDFFLEENEGKSADPVLRLHDKKVNVVEKEYNVTRKLYIDIFPIDGMPNSEKATIKLFAKLRRCRIVIVFGTVYHSGSYTGFDRKAKLKHIFAKIYGVDRAHKKIKKLCLKYSYETSQYIGVSNGLFKLSERRIKPKKEEYCEVKFEGYKFYAIKEWNAYLNALYGDYMKLPPAAERHAHFLKAEQVDEADML